MGLGAWVMLGALLALGPVSAAAESLDDCREIEQPEARLACYDRLATGAEPSDPQRAGEKAGGPSERARGRGPDGAGAPGQAQKPQRGDGDDRNTRERVTERAENRPESSRGAGNSRRDTSAEADSDATGGDRVDLAITAIEEDPYGRKRFTLDNGEQWMQAGHGRVVLRRGDRVKLHETAFGAWFMREVAASGRAVKVRRVGRESG